MARREAETERALTIVRFLSEIEIEPFSSTNHCSKMDLLGADLGQVQQLQAILNNIIDGEVNNLYLHKYKTINYNLSGSVRRLS